MMLFVLFFVAFAAAESLQLNGEACVDSLQVVDQVLRKVPDIFSQTTSACSGSNVTCMKALAQGEAQVASSMQGVNAQLSANSSVLCVNLTAPCPTEVASLSKTCLSSVAIYAAAFNVCLNATATAAKSKSTTENCAVLFAEATQHALDLMLQGSRTYDDCIIASINVTATRKKVRIQ